MQEVVDDYTGSTKEAHANQAIYMPRIVLDL